MFWSFQKKQKGETQNHNDAQRNTDNDDDDDDEKQKSEGVWLVDAITGRKILDGFSFFATQALGQNHPKMTGDPEFRRRLADVAMHKPPNADVYTVELAQFVATFRRVMMPAAFKHLFLISGGSAAVGNAIKCAVDWKVRKNKAAGEEGEIGKKVIYFEDAFHGRTGFPLSATKSAVHKYQYFPRFDWICVRGPPCTSIGLTADESHGEVERALTDVRAAVSADVAAILIEPMQGEGGDTNWPDEFLVGLRRLADEMDVMLIFDEVQTGVGTTGRRWAFEHLGETAVPDIVAFGKKVQVSGIMATSRVDQVAENVFTVSGRIDSTWGGNLTDMVRARRILEIIEEDGLFENAARVGAYMLKRLEQLSAEFPMLTRPRGRGLFIGATLPTPEQRATIIRLALEEGLIILSCGPSSIRFRPPLIFTNSDVDTLIAILKRALARMCPK